MKSRALLLTLCAATLHAAPAVFHVDAQRGNDAHSGSAEQPWRTLTHAAKAMPEDAECQVRAGTYRGRVVAKDGQKFIAAEGARPVVTGAAPVTQWRRHMGGAGIYTARVAERVRAVFCRGAAMDLAQHPNHRGERLSIESWAELTIRSLPGDRLGGIAWSGLGGDADAWKGAHFCGLAGENSYSAIEGEVVASDGGGVTIAQANFYLRRQEFQGPGRGYLIGHLRALDAPGEWFWQDGTLYFHPPDSADPATLAVEAQTELWGFDLTGKKRVRLEGLEFRGASALLDGAEDCTVVACRFFHHAPWGRETGAEAVGERHWYRFGVPRDGTAGLVVSGRRNVVRDCHVAHAWGAGISVSGADHLVENCVVEDVGWHARQDVAPVWMVGARQTIRGCTLRRAAGMGLCATQRGGELVKTPRLLHNRIDDVGRLLVDSGSSGIYIANHDAPTDDRSLAGGEIAWNHLSGIGVARGDKGFGIYLDDGTDHARIHHNVVEGGGRIRWGIFLHFNTHQTDQVEIFHNTLWQIRGAAVHADGHRKKGGTRGVVMRNNLAGDGAGGFTTGAGELRAEGNAAGATAADFADAAAHDFTLRATAKFSAGASEKGTPLPRIGSTLASTPRSETNP